MITDAMRNVLIYRWIIFTLLAFGYILVYFHRLCPAVLAVDIMQDLSAGGSMTGLLGAAYFYPYALMQLPAGLLSDSWGPRRTITLFFVVAAGGAAVMGFSTTVAWAIIGRTIVGVGAAMLFVPTLKILAEWFRKREFAYMTGLLLAMGGVGTLIATTPLVWLSNRVGWRNAFTLVGGLTLIMAVLVGVFVRNRPGDLGWPSPLEPSPSAECPRPGLAAGMKTVLTCPAFWPLAAWFFFDFGIFFAIAGLWGGPYLVHVYGMSRAETGHILVMLAVGLVVGAPVVSWLSDRVFRRRKPVLMLCAAGMLLVIGLLAFKTAAIPLWGLYGIFFFMTFFGNAAGVIAFTMNKELFPLGIAGTATGLVNLFPFAGGAVFQPLLGYVLEQRRGAAEAFTPAGYEAAFGVMFVAAVIAFGAALLTRETLEIT